MNDFPWAEESKNLSFNNSGWNIFSVPFRLHSAWIENKFCAEYSNISNEKTRKFRLEFKNIPPGMPENSCGNFCGHGETFVRGGAAGLGEAPKGSDLPFQLALSAVGVCLHSCCVSRLSQKLFSGFPVHFGSKKYRAFLLRISAAISLGS